MNEQQEPKKLTRAEELCAIGMSYLSGHGGFPRDSKIAVRYFREAADMGSAFACERLGNCYQGGIGIGRDSDAAAVWFAKALEGGCEAARDRLTTLYIEEARFDKLYELYKDMKQKGMGECYCIARHYFDNAKDNAEAFKWAREAVLLGSDEAAGILAYCYWLGEGVKEDRDIGDIFLCQAFRLARYHLELPNPVTKLGEELWKRYGAADRRAVDAATHCYSIFGKICAVKGTSEFSKKVRSAGVKYVWNDMYMTAIVDRCHSYSPLGGHVPTIDEISAEFETAPDPEA